MRQTSGERQDLETALRAYEIDPASPVVNNVITYIAVGADEDVGGL